MIKEMVKGEKEKMLERNLYIHNTGMYEHYLHKYFLRVSITIN